MRKLKIYKVLIIVLNGERKGERKKDDHNAFLRKNRKPEGGSSATVYFSTSPRDGVNEIPEEAVKRGTGGWLCSGSAKAP